MNFWMPKKEESTHVEKTEIWHAQIEVSSEKSEQDEVDEMKQAADSVETGW